MDNLLGQMRTPGKVSVAQVRKTLLDHNINIPLDTGAPYIGLRPAWFNGVEELIRQKLAFVHCDRCESVVSKCPQCSRPVDFNSLQLSHLTDWKDYVESSLDYQKPIPMSALSARILFNDILNLQYKCRTCNLSIDKIGGNIANRTRGNKNVVYQNKINAWMSDE